LAIGFVCCIDQGFIQTMLILPGSTIHAAHSVGFIPSHPSHLIRSHSITHYVVILLRLCYGRLPDNNPSPSIVNIWPLPRTNTKTKNTLKQDAPLHQYRLGPVDPQPQKALAWLACRHSEMSMPVHPTATGWTCEALDGPLRRLHHGHPTLSVSLEAGTRN
jgi:hypothetical protein